MPTALGHEASGIVELVGQGVTDIGVGDKVIVCDQTFCGRCPACQSGHMVYCVDTGPKQRQHQRMTIAGMPIRQYLGVGAFAEHMLVDANALIRMPPGLGFDAAALLSCCLTTGLATVFNVARVRPGDQVAVLGCGGVGLGAIQATRIAGAIRIIAVDPVPHRRDIAVQLGATDVLDPTTTSTVEAVLKLSDGGVDHAIEAVGQPVTAAEAFAMLRPAGQATVLGMMPPGTDIPIPGRLLRQGRKLVGTVMGAVRTRADIPRYAQLALSGQLDTDLLVTSGRSLDDANSALADAQAHRGVREMLHF